MKTGKYSLTMKDMKLGAKEYMFNHERHPALAGLTRELARRVMTEMKQEENTSQRIAAGTPAIIR